MPRTLKDIEKWIRVWKLTEDSKIPLRVGDDDIRDGMYQYLTIKEVKELKENYEILSPDDDAWFQEDCE